ncbi:MAG: replication and repair protein RecF [Firmicutes bacterium]|nr:replication and repair protein RecF [Bacillota bacterium]
MYVKYLRLKNYRNYDELDIELNSKVNVFIGDNAQGKTNILESIYFCSIGKSHRTSKDKELIRWDQREASMSVYVAKERLDKKIDISIFREGKKSMTINTIKVSKVSDLIGTLNVVMFSPEDLKIVKESPSHRRRFMDIELCKLNKKYYYNLVQYNKVLDERNSALKKWRQINDDILDIYDEQIAGYGRYIVSERQKLIDKLNEKGSQIHRDITSGNEEIRFKYVTCGAEDIGKKLRENREKDFERKTTSTGPHRDDFDISINGIDTRSYGSQGQQRTSVLTIKFATIEIIREMTGEYPVLLLDDVLSELDINRQKYILNSINSIQTIITCTGISDIKEYLDGGAAIYKVSSGSVKKSE